MYTCQKDYLGQDEACVRMKTPGKVNGGVSFAECKLTCGLDLQVWPKINGDSNKMKVARFGSTYLSGLNEFVNKKRASKVFFLGEVFPISFF